MSNIFNSNRRESLEMRLKILKERLTAYYEREIEILDKNSVKSYGIGSRNVSRYDTALADIQKAIRDIESQIFDIENLLVGGFTRKSVQVIPRD